MSAQTEIDRIITAVTNAHKKVLAKGGTTAEPYLVANLEGAIDTIPEANTPAVVEEKDVNFWDYDGTLLYSYTLEELHELTELPSNAEYEGLVGQGWNWSLEELLENNEPMDVGALYVTSDGATWFDLENDWNRDVTVTFLWKQYADNGATIDFGDGSEPYSVSGTGNLSVTHTYSPGTYRAKISGEYNFYGTSTSCCVNDIAAGGSSLLKRVFLGSIDYVYGYSFFNCARLVEISLPRECGFSGGQIFYYCSSLRGISVPGKKDIPMVSGSTFTGCGQIGVISFGSYITEIYSAPPNCRRLRLKKNGTFANVSFANNSSLVEITIPSGTTSLPSRFLQLCAGMLEITVPASVQTINTYAFYNSINLRVLRFEGEIPPTVLNANAFNGLPTDCIVEVHAASLTEYQEATNYSGIAAQMVGV